jgi:hypothetical protein
MAHRGDLQLKMDTKLLKELDIYHSQKAVTIKGEKW